MKSLNFDNKSYPFKYLSKCESFDRRLDWNFMLCVWQPFVFQIKHKSISILRKDQLLLVLVLSIKGFRFLFLMKTAPYINLRSAEKKICSHRFMYQIHTQTYSQIQSIASIRKVYFQKSKKGMVASNGCSIISYFPF